MTDEETKRRAVQHAQEALRRQQRDREAAEAARRDRENQRIARENAARYKRDQQQKGK